MTFLIAHHSHAPVWPKLAPAADGRADVWNHGRHSQQLASANGRLLISFGGHRVRVTWQERQRNQWRYGWCVSMLSVLCLPLNSSHPISCSITFNTAIIRCFFQSFTSRAGSPSCFRMFLSFMPFWYSCDKSVYNPHHASKVFSSGTICTYLTEYRSPLWKLLSQMAISKGKKDLKIRFLEHLMNKNTWFCLLIATMYQMFWEPKNISGIR